MCSMSTSEHLETLSSATSVAEGSGGLGARVLSAVGDCGGRASPAAADREPATVAADPVGFPVADADGGSGAAMVVFTFLFALLITAGGGGEDTTGGAAEPVSSPVQEECGVECDILLSLRNAENSGKLSQKTPHEKEKKKELGDSEFGERTSIGRRTSEKPSDSEKFAELQNDEERRKFREMLWVRKFLREMPKKAKVRKMGSERGFIGKGGEWVKSLRVVSPPSLELAPRPSDENLPIAI